MRERILVSGGLGFIGSNLCKLLQYQYKHVDILDSETYAARPDYLDQVMTDPGWRHNHLKFDIRHPLNPFIDGSKYDVVYHLAAESHVCTSILNPRLFFETNTMGTFNLLSALRETGFKGRFIHVSTDEVFGEAENGELFTEESALCPRSPYSASKAASDHVALAFHHTFGTDVVVTHCSNNFGFNQHEEKLIPKTIISAIKKQPMTVYNGGTHVRDWLWVEDHCRALMLLAEKGQSGRRYCIGANNERTVNDVVEDVVMALRFHGFEHELEVKNTSGRPTDDRRYAINASQVRLLGWKPDPNYHDRMRDTVAWYLKEYGEMKKRPRALEQTL